MVDAGGAWLLGNLLSFGLHQAAPRPSPPSGHLLLHEGRQCPGGRRMRRSSPSLPGARRHGWRATGARALERPHRRRGRGAERGLGRGYGEKPPQ
ncbi:hypothetical protein XMIN_3630 [Xanthomonas citri pv. mangiferaeindicae LMG 941]|nr:hypothetical protein XMIN_3630 [Xanthomonas citri pv. mangiferaeindicae LMG 941]